MFTIISGTPGAGKSIYALHLMKTDPDLQGRPLYINGMKTTIDHKYLDDPMYWYEVPDGSVIFIDEAWRFFPPLKPGQQAPKAITEMRTHRHRGIDIIVATQSPKDLHSAVRRLANRHFHLHSPGNVNRATVTAYEGVSEGDNKLRPYEKKVWKYDKSLFDEYESTSLDTHKARLPKGFYIRLAIVVFAVLALPLMGWFAFSTLKGTWDRAQGNNLSAEESRSELSTDGLAQFDPQILGEISRRQGYKGEIIDDWRDPTEPRIEGQPWTAPVFDEMREPEAPMRVACVIKHRPGVADICRCYDQRAIMINVTPGRCFLYARQGRYAPELYREREKDRIPGAAAGGELASPAAPALLFSDGVDIGPFIPGFEGQAGEQPGISTEVMSGQIP